MAEEFVNKANAAAFLSAYNKIDAQLRALYNFGSGQSFTDIVRRCAEKNAVVRRYEDELAEYARLRNAIVHQSTDGRVVAVPCDEVTREMERIASLLTEPPRIRDALPEKKVVSIEAGISLRQAVLLISRTGHSNLPVYAGRRMVGIVNNRRIIREVGAQLSRGQSVDAFLSETPVGDILDESDMFIYYKYLSENATLEEVLSAFETNKKLIAVVVSERGRMGERIRNIVTPADLVHISRKLEDFR